MSACLSSNLIDGGDLSFPLLQRTHYLVAPTPKKAASYINILILWWWDCIALPDDVASCDEASFRMQIRDLAFALYGIVGNECTRNSSSLLWRLLVAYLFKSLQLLKDAIFHKGCAPLFSLEIYGHIIGMFELNNLDLVVASPVEDYFIYVDDLQVREKEEAEKLTRPFLDALDDEYSVFLSRNCFLPTAELHEPFMLSKCQSLQKRRG